MSEILLVFHQFFRSVNKFHRPLLEMRYHRSVCRWERELSVVLQEALLWVELLLLAGHRLVNLVAH